MTIVRSGPVSGQGIDKLFGFESIVRQNLENLNLAAGTNNLNGTAVGTGKVWKITHAGIQYMGTVPAVVDIYLKSASGDVALLSRLAPVSGQYYFWDGEVLLGAGDYMRGRVIGATLNDDLAFNYAGVQMNAP